MPVISRIGRRSLKVRLVLGSFYLLLILGSLTMIYPLLLMVSGSLKSESDIMHLSPVPAFLHNDEVLFRKYAESKYLVNMRHIRAAWGTREARSLETLTPPPLEAAQTEPVRLFRAWRESETIPSSWYYLGHTIGGQMLPENGRLFRRHMMALFDGDIVAFEQATEVPTEVWHGVFPPNDYLGWGRLYNDTPRGLVAYYLEFKETRPAHDRVFFNLDAYYALEFLTARYDRGIERYNARHGTAHDDFLNVLLPRRPPPEPAARADWETFVRAHLNPHFIRFDPGLAEPFRAFLRDRYESIEPLNAAWGATLASFAAVELPERVPDAPLARVDLLDFIQDANACPLDGLRVHGPRHDFEDFAAAARGLSLAEIEPLAMPVRETDLADLLDRRREIRREFLTRNYKHVWQYLAQHGRGLRNTVVYCLMAILASLLVNPLAAYGLSRYKPPSAYKLILFFMATMAFPHAVTMIPNFMLLRRFPLWSLLGALGVFAACVWLIARFLPRVKESWRLVLSLGIAVLFGWTVFPRWAGRETVSLLNTFTALVLPTMANGYFIFLLKGFFDSLPRELYEAADLDGASEWTKFWVLTINLSQPILAVIALQAFVAAYSNFMMALIIIPDQRMWTLMVWIYTLQTQAHPSVIYASLVVAAIPTFIIFSLCQRVIIRGIVVPTEK